MTEYIKDLAVENLVVDYVLLKKSAVGPFPSIKGDTGEQGTQGYQGRDGEKGYQGEKGDQGFPGTRGFQGLQGPIGYQGD